MWGQFACAHEIGKSGKSIILASGLILKKLEAPFLSHGGLGVPGDDRSFLGNTKRFHWRIHIAIELDCYFL